MGSLMAMEVVREVVGFGDGLVGRLLMVDARALRFDTVRYGWDEANPLSGNTPTASPLPGGER
jgi:molybdopterin/thiamine biosynthesis adenylyltransferase